MNIKPCLAMAVLAAMLISASVAVAEPAPEMKLTSIDGEKINLVDLRGKYILLNFFASWCGPCHKEAPTMVKLQKKYGPQGLVILGLALSSPEKALREFIKKYGINYPVVVYGDKELEAYGGVRGVPTMIFVDQKGNMVDGLVGAHPEATVEKKVQDLLNG